MKKSYLISLLIMMFTGIFPGMALITDAVKVKIRNTSSSDETVIRFLQGCDENYNSGYDAQKLFSSAPVPAIYTKTLSGTSLSINAQGPLVNDVQVPVYIRIPSAGSYQISAALAGAFAPGVKIILEDLATGSKTEILNDTVLFNASGAQLNPSLPSYLIHFVTPVQVVSITGQSCAGQDGSVVIQKITSSPLPYSVEDSLGAMVFSSITTTSFDTIQNLSAGSYDIKVYYDSQIYTEASFTVGITDLPVAEFIVLDANAIAGTPVTFKSLSTGYELLEWNFGDAFGNDSVISHTYNDAGNYEVLLTAINGGCIDSVVKQITVSAVTSTHGDNEKPIKVIINNQAFHITDFEGAVRIYDASGKLVTVTNVLPHETLIQINLSLTAGIYFVQAGNTSYKLNINPNN